MIKWIVLAAVIAVTGARSNSPLLDDSTRTRNKAAECVFGKQVRELGSQWIPDLGVPIGILYCMKCECVPMHKKRRVVARVQCRSIKNECPEPTCEEPVHLPGRCCKTCPGDPDSVGIEILPQNVTDIEEKSSTKHYTALLTERSSLVLRNDFTKLTSNNLNKNNVVATGRFTFHKKNLYYSFYISDKAARPRSLQFVDSDGNILEEFVLSRSGGLVNSLYQNATRKVCGVWRRIPHEYRKRFRQDKIYVVLVWGVKDQAEFTLSGQVTKYPALASENFSSLLEPAGGTSSAMAGAGGTAIVSISTSVPTSIYLAIVFNGLFGVEDEANVPINVTLSLDDKKYILQEVVHVKKPHYALNMIEVRSPVTSADLRHLTRGRLILSISSVSKPEEYRLSGSVLTKVTCELFQTTLAPSASDPDGDGISGLAWLYLNNEGSLVYNVQIDNLRTTPDNTTFITLVDVSTKRRTELEDLTPSFANGWANGTLVKLIPKVLEPLYSGNLAVNVATPKDTSLIRGRLVAKPVADARDAPAPFLLKRENYTLPSSAVGLAWLYIDNDCYIHYDVSFSGLGPTDRRFELTLEMLPMLAPGAPVITRFLEEFQGNQIEGSPVNSLTSEEINRLDSGVGFLKVKEKDTKITLLVATIRHVISPPLCQRPGPDPDIGIVDDTYIHVGSHGDCLYEGKFYQEGSQWLSAANPCTMCFCENGVNKCFTMNCPAVVCPSNMKLMQMPEECCPICVNATTLMEVNRNVPPKCIFNGQPYSPGSKFHPFLIPTGFDSCTICSCDPVYHEIKCTRISNEKDCCRNCGRQDLTMNGTFTADEEATLVLKVTKPQMSPKTAEKILAQGGCANLYNPKEPHPNGSKYHPAIASLGEYKCVTCRCENGRQLCERKCNKAMCEERFKMKKRRRLGEDPKPINSCCSVKECRQYRHKKSHRPQKS